MEKHIYDLSGHLLYVCDHTPPWPERPTEQDLRNANLKERDLRGWDFTESDLSGADLRNVDLSGAILRGTNFTSALMDGVILDEDTRTDDKTIFPEGVKEIEAYLEAKRVVELDAPRRRRNGLLCAHFIRPHMEELAKLLPSSTDTSFQADHDRLHAVENYLVQAGVAPDFENLDLEEIDHFHRSMKNSLIPYGDDLNILYSAFKPGETYAGGNHRKFAMECIDTFLFLGGWRGNRPGFEGWSLSRDCSNAIVERDAREYYPRVIALFFLVREWLETKMEGAPNPMRAFSYRDPKNGRLCLIDSQSQESLEKFKDVIESECEREKISFEDFARQVEIWENAPEDDRKKIQKEYRWDLDKLGLLMDELNENWPENKPWFNFDIVRATPGSYYAFSFFMTKWHHDGASSDPLFALVGVKAAAIHWPLLKKRLDEHHDIQQRDVVGEIGRNDQHGLIRANDRGHAPETTPAPPKRKRMRWDKQPGRNWNQEAINFYEQKMKADGALSVPTIYASWEKQIRKLKGMDTQGVDYPGQSTFTTWIRDYKKAIELGLRRPRQNKP